MVISEVTLKLVLVISIYLIRKENAYHVALFAKLVSLKNTIVQVVSKDFFFVHQTINC